MNPVLITAGASGIGRVIGQTFADAGADVWVTDVDAAALATLPTSWRGTLCDSGNPEAMADLFAQIGKDWGGIETLCANAGIKGPTALVEEVDPADWRACLAVNLDGAFLAAKGALPLMKAAGKGAIVFTSSTAGIYGYPYRSPYAAAKWAVIGLMKTVAMEAGPHGIRANAILPGSVEGPRMERVLQAEAAAKGMTRDQVYDAYAGGTSLRTFVSASDVANLALFLASDAARHISGQAIPVDGHTVNPDPQVGPS